MNKNFNQHLKKIFDFIRRNYRQILMGIIILLGVVYVVLIFAAPKLKIVQINREFSDSLKKYQYGKEYPYSENPDLFVLYEEKALITSKLALADSGTIGAVIDLQDSIINLEINGLAIHSIQISRYKVSRVFKALDHQVFLALFAVPFTTQKNIGTIEKEPIIVKKAPKDTIEAARSASIPDTLIFGPAYVAMILDYHICLSIYQEKTGSLREGSRRFFFNSGIRFSQAADDLWHMVRFKIPDHKPEIRIYIPKDDLITIYRALPVNAKVVIRI